MTNSPIYIFEASESIVKKRIVDRVNSSLMYIGEHIKADALTSDNGWRIRRIVSGVPDDLTAHPASGNLVGWWRMGDDATFPNIQDDSGNGLNGLCVNMASSANFVNDSPGS